jgi:HK97 gp10 family phage protein
MVAVTVKLTGVDGVLETLKALPAEVVSKRGGPVKTALRAGARVILREAALNLAHATENLTQDDSESTGLLLKSLIASRGKPPPGVNGERYLVRVKRRTYERKGKKVTTQQTARFLEYGTSQQPAEPWLRPAVLSKGQQAIDTTTQELVKGIDRVVKKLAAQNRGK